MILNDSVMLAPAARLKDDRPLLWTILKDGLPGGGPPRVVFAETRLESPDQLGTSSAVLIAKK